ncbi:MAG: hypothetical protein ACPL7M_11110, partial [Bryobacteraceae bacterium]
AGPGSAQPRVERWPHGDYARLARQRRSALDFVPEGRILPEPAFAAMLELLAAPLGTDWSERFVAPWIFVHRVENVEAGLYRAEGTRLELVRRGDQRVAAAALSLGQELAGSS